MPIEDEAIEVWGQEDCDICGEDLKPTDEVAEMFDPGTNAIPGEEPANDHVICHAQCGLSAGYEVA